MQRIIDVLRKASETGEVVGVELGMDIVVGRIGQISIPGAVADSVDSTSDELDDIQFEFIGGKVGDYHEVVQIVRLSAVDRVKLLRERADAPFGSWKTLEADTYVANCLRKMQIDRDDNRMQKAVSKVPGVIEAEVVGYQVKIHVYEATDPIAVMSAVAKVVSDTLNTCDDLRDLPRLPARVPFPNMPGREEMLSMPGRGRGRGRGASTLDAVLADMMASDGRGAAGGGDLSSMLDEMFSMGGPC